MRFLWLGGMLLFFLLPVERGFADDIKVECVSRTENFAAKLGKDIPSTLPHEENPIARFRILKVDDRSFFYRCQDIPGFEFAVFANRAEKWTVQPLQVFPCLRIELSKGGGKFRYQDACPNTWYHPPACETHEDTFAVNDGVLVITEKKVSSKPICAVCAKLGSCGIAEIRKEAKSRFDTGNASGAYDLLKDYYEHFRDVLENGSQGLDPWFASDLLFYAAKAKVGCEFANKLVAREGLVKWTEASQKAANFNQELCRRSEGPR